MREFSAEPVAIQYISSAHLAVVVEIPSTRAEIVSLQNSPSLPEPRLQTEMRAKKVVVADPQRHMLARQNARICEGSEPLMFSFDEDLEQEEKRRRYLAPVYHLYRRLIAPVDSLYRRLDWYVT